MACLKNSHKTIDSLCVLSMKASYSSCICLAEKCPLSAWVHRIGSFWGTGHLYETTEIPDLHKELWTSMYLKCLLSHNWQLCQIHQGVVAVKACLWIMHRVPFVAGFFSYAKIMNLKCSLSIARALSVQTPTSFFHELIFSWKKSETCQTVGSLSCCLQCFWGRISTSTALSSTNKEWQYQMAVLSFISVVALNYNRRQNI